MYVSYQISELIVRYDSPATILDKEKAETYRASWRLQLKMPSKETEFKEKLDAAWDEVGALTRDPVTSDQYSRKIISLVCKISI